MPVASGDGSGVVMEAADKPDHGIAIGAILQKLAQDQATERLTIGQLVAAMGDRAFGPLLVVFALPNVLPTPPGTAGVLGIPLLFLAVQMLLGRQPWLPDFLERRSMSRAGFARFADRATAILARASRFLRPRLTFFVWPAAERLIGGFCLVLTLVLMLPIPFANSTPAFAICLFGLGLMERDGVWIVVAMIATCAALLLAGWLGTTLVEAIWQWAQTYWR